MRDAIKDFVHDTSQAFIDFWFEMLPWFLGITLGIASVLAILVFILFIIGVIWRRL